jgi:hypothetical protein
MKRLDSFRNQYGFSRNLGFASIVVGIAILFRWWSNHDPNLLKYGTTSVVAGLLLLYRFLKFFRQYTYELFNSYAAGQL